DNVRVIPGHDRNEPLVPLLRRPRTESTGELFGLRADYVALRTEAFDAWVGYSFFGTYNNDLPSFNIMDHLGTVGVLHRTAVADMPAQVSAQYAFDILFLDEREFVRRHTATLAAVLLASDRHLTQVFARYQHKDFTDRPRLLFPAEDRDANNWMGGVLHILRFAGDRHFIKGGFQYDYEDTAGRNYTYDGYRFLAGAQYTLPWWAIRLQYDFDVHVRDYTHRNTLLPSTNPNSRRRQDEEITNIVRAELPLPHDFTLSTQYQSTINHSNLAIFDYTRNVVSITLSWVY
ncbi:MAG TPA: hypothetical protein VMR23_08085, partial [Candidatus Limnocylindria bacterium]|nr:hypothetical protein [Candidatus Limnocylindria bacterium]